jgi:hypothetical protein
MLPSVNSRSISTIHIRDSRAVSFFAIKLLMIFDRSEFIALTISIAIEALIVGSWGIIRRLEWRSLMMVASASTLVTHPILWKLFNDLLPYLSFNTLSLLLEVPVVMIEGWMYKLAIGYSWRSSLALSFGANLGSYTFGLLIYQL